MRGLLVPRKAKITLLWLIYLLVKAETAPFTSIDYYGVVRFVQLCDCYHKRKHKVYVDPRYCKCKDALHRIEDFWLYAYYMDIG